MGVRSDCRHYSSRSSGEEVIQRCRVGANDDTPFACPEGCVFFEARNISSMGWQRHPTDEGTDSDSR